MTTINDFLHLQLSISILVLTAGLVFLHTASFWKMTLLSLQRTELIDFVVNDMLFFGPKAAYWERTA